MSKLIGNQKISLSKTYNIHISDIKYLVRLFDYHGIDIFRNKKNKYYIIELKL